MTVLRLVAVTLLVACTGCQTGVPEARPAGATSAQQVADTVVGAAGGNGDLYRFWREEFTVQWPRRPLEELASRHAYRASEPPDLACDPPSEWADNAFYCADDASVSWDRDFLETVRARIGPFGTALVLAHEYGHHIQAALQGRITRSGVQRELMADCLAGVWAASAEQSGVYERPALTAGKALFHTVGDGAEDQRWFAPAVHGEPQVRMKAFARGYEGPTNVCLRTYDRRLNERIVTLGGGHSMAVRNGASRRQDNGDWRLRSRGGLQAHVGWRPELPRRHTAAEVFAPVARTWFPRSAPARFLHARPPDLSFPGGTVAYSRYTQVADGRLRRGWWVLQLFERGGGLVYDVYASNAARPDEAAFKDSRHYLCELLAGAKPFPDRVCARR